MHFSVISPPEITLSSLGLILDRGPLVRLPNLGCLIPVLRGSLNPRKGFAVWRPTKPANRISVRPVSFVGWVDTTLFIPGYSNNILISFSLLMTRMFSGVSYLLWLPPSLPPVRYSSLSLLCLLIYQSAGNVKYSLHSF